MYDKAGGSSGNRLPRSRTCGTPRKVLLRSNIYQWHLSFRISQSTLFLLKNTGYCDRVSP